MYPASIVHHFQSIFGSTPTIIVRAPGRINLIGEHTDYNDGFVLPAAIDKAIWLAVSARSDNEISLVSYDLQETHQSSLGDLKQSGKGWPDYLLGTFGELLKDGYNIGGVNVVFGGDIPSGGGLSSSAAIESGMLFALNHLFDLHLDRPQMARLAQRSENNFVGMQCGIMDMYASLMGRPDHALRLDCRSLETQYFPIQLPDHVLLLCNTGVKHALVDSEYNTRRRESEAGVQLIRVEYPQVQNLRDVELAMLDAVELPAVVAKRCRYVVEENNRVIAACSALDQHDLTQFGALMYASHDGLQHLYEVSCPELDFLVEMTRSDDRVQGARMMGGGFGGCTINLVKKDALPTLIPKLKSAYLNAFGIQLETFVTSIGNGVSVVRND